MASYDAVANCEESKSFDSDFTFEWEIENFAMLAAHRLIGYLDSPIFRISFLEDSTWYLRLLTNSISNPYCMLYGSEIFSGKFEFRVCIEIFHRIHSPQLSYIQYRDRVFVDSQSPCVLFKDFRLHLHPAEYEMPTDWLQSLIVKCTVWELPYVGIPDPRIRNLPEQPLSYDWQDLSFMSSPNGKKDVRICRPHISRGYTQVDVFEKTVTWTIEKFLTREPESKRSLYLESSFGDLCPLIITLYVSGESNTKGNLIVELWRDCQRVIECLLVRCQIFVEGRYGKGTIFPSTTHILDRWYPWVLHTDLNINTTERNGIEYGDTIFSENGSLTLRFDIELTLQNAEHLTKSTFFLWERSTLNPVQDFKQAMQKIFSKQRVERWQARGLFDVQLRSCDGRIFNCHKIVLAARSSVFADRFQTDDLLLIDDVHSDTLKRLLHFVYSAFMEILDVDQLLELYSAASAYKLSSLMGACMNRLKWMFTRNNIEEIKKVAFKCEDKRLAMWVDRELSLFSTVVDN